MNNYSTPQGQFSPGERVHRQPSPEETLKTDKIQVERKTFVLVLKENARGRFLRITEDVGGRRDSIIVPVTGLEEFRRIVEDMAKAAREIPVKPVSPETPAL